MKTVFVDVDTQFDFLYPAGALYVPGAERITAAIAQLNRYAAARSIPVLSTVDAHAEDDPEFRTYPSHCVSGTLGQHKAESTLLDRRVTIPNRADAMTAIAGARQIVLEKQTVNAFETVTISEVLQQLAADHFVVYGVVTEICVLWAARGLMKAGKRVTVISEAVKELASANRDRAFAEVRAAGGRIIGIGELESALTKCDSRVMPETVR